MIIFYELINHLSLINWLYIQINKWKKVVRSILACLINVLVPLLDSQSYVTGSTLPVRPMLLRIYNDYKPLY